LPTYGQSMALPLIALVTFLSSTYWLSVNPITVPSVSIHTTKGTPTCGKYADSKVSSTTVGSETDWVYSFLDQNVLIIRRSCPVTGKMNKWSAYLRCNESDFGNDLMHGAHQVDQKSSIKILPLTSARSIFPPA